MGVARNPVLVVGMAARLGAVDVTVGARVLTVVVGVVVSVDVCSLVVGGAVA
ncbi:MAG: hypothetical protein QOE41_2587, partial [Mycobacterium sp.]|nr:hypothetical protein [Mycobacterium sp.]